MNNTKKYIGTIMAALVVLSTLLVLGMPNVEADEMKNPVLWGFVGVSDPIDEDMSFTRMEGVTVQLYKTFDIYTTEPYESVTSNDVGYFRFEVPPGHYLLSMEPMTKDGNFYHPDFVGKIEVGKLEYNTHTKNNVPLAEKEINAHFHGKVTDIVNLVEVDVAGATVRVWNDATGFDSTDVTDQKGLYSVDVYDGTFDVSVSVGGVQKKYTPMTVGITTDGKETFVLAEVPNEFTVKVNGAVHNDRVRTGKNIEVSELNNNDKVTIDYNWIEVVEENKGDFPNITAGTVKLDEVVHGGASGIVKVYFVNPTTGTHTIPATDYTYKTTTRELTINSVVNGTLWVDYDVLREENEFTHAGETFTEFYVGRNVEDINLESPRISGHALDSVTKSPIESSTPNVRVVLFNLDTHRIHARNVYSVFSVKAPAGNYIIVVHPEGYAPYTYAGLGVSGNLNLNNKLGDENMTFSKISSEAQRTTHFTFPDEKCWNNLTVEWTVVLDSWNHLPGLGDDVSNIRLQIDAKHGNGDGELNQTEVNNMITDLETKQPEFLSTIGLFSFNGTRYSFVDGTYNVGIDMADMNLSSSEPITLTMSANYTSLDHIVYDAAQYPAVLTAPRDTGEYRISLHPLYARSDSPATNKPRDEGEVDIVIDSANKYGTIPMSIKKISLPTPYISVSATPMVARSETTYVVKHWTNVTFNGAGSSVADGEIAYYKWNFGDGTVTEWIDESSMVHNYTTSHSAGRTVTLSVKDTAGQVVALSITVIPDGDAPNVVLSANETNVGQNEPIQFNGSGSNDLVTSSENLTFNWNFGDGIISTDKEPLHSYSRPGTYVVYLNVTDEMGNMGTEQTTITVGDTTPPTAQVVVDRNVMEGDEVTFNASTSFDNEGEITGYKWDFGDGTVTEWLTVATVEHTFAVAGTYNVNLTVKDDVGLNDTLMIAMNVRVGPRPDIEVLEIRIDGDVVNGKSTTVTVLIVNRGDVNCTEPITVELKEGSKVVGTATVAPLAKGQNGTATFQWTPSSKGNLLLTANATSSEEWITTLFNNVLTKDVSVEPNAMERYGSTIIVLVVIVVLLVLLFGRDKIKDMMGGRPKSSESMEKSEKKGKKGK